MTKHPRSPPVIRLGLVKLRRRTAALAVIAAILDSLTILEAAAQPEPSFRAGCGELRAAIEALRPSEETLVTIQVVGPLTEVRFDGALAYMAMCSPPDPQVLCVTYSTDGREAGDVVALSGAYSAYGPDHILLDPCLHSPAHE